MNIKIELRKLFRQRDLGSPRRSSRPFNDRRKNAQRDRRAGKREIHQGRED